MRHLTVSEPESVPDPRSRSRSSSAPSVAVDRVTVRFGDRAVLNGLSVRISGPGIVAVMGPSGVGKTTLLHVVAGLVKVSSGSVSVDGLDGRPIAWVVQNSPILPGRSAQENVALGAVIDGVEWQQAQESALPVMASLGIAHLAGVHAYKLSGGERQRVAVARAITSASPVIFADEPTASLDELSRELVCDALSKAASEGALVVVSTHDPVVAEIAQRVLHLSAGRISRDSIDENSGDDREIEDAP